MVIADVMAAIADALSEIDGLRAYAWAADQAQPPCALVDLPEVVTFDSTFQRGADEATFQILLGVSSAVDRATVGLLGPYLAGSGDHSVKAALEADRTLGGTVHSCRVTQATVSPVQIAGVVLMGAIFDLEVIG